MRTLRGFDSYASYDLAWQSVAATGLRDLNLDVWAGGRRYLSLATLCLSAEEFAQLRAVATRFHALLNIAVQRILDDPDWWPSLAWPWPAIELARQEVMNPQAQELAVIDGEEPAGSATEQLIEVVHSYFK